MRDFSKTNLSGIHHWRIFWSSYRTLAWVRFEPATTEFRSDALTDWVIRPWVQLALRAKFVQLLQIHRLFRVTFYFSCFTFVSRHVLFYSKFSVGNHMSVAKWADTYGMHMHNWQIFWSSYRKLTWVGFEPMTTEFRSNPLSFQAMSSTRIQSQLFTATPISLFVQSHISFRLFCLRQ